MQRSAVDRFRLAGLNGPSGKQHAVQIKLCGLEFPQDDDDHYHYS